MTGSKSALEAMCTLTGGEEKLSGSTLEKAHLVIRTAQRMTHSVRHFGNKAHGSATSRTHALHDSSCKGSGHAD